MLPKILKVLYNGLFSRFVVSHTMSLITEYCTNCTVCHGVTGCHKDMFKFIKFNIKTYCILNPKL